MGGPAHFTVDGDGKRTTHRTHERAVKEAIKRSKETDKRLCVKLTFVEGVILGLFEKGKLL